MPTCMPVHAWIWTNRNGQWRVDDGRTWWCLCVRMCTEHLPSIMMADEVLIASHRALVSCVWHLDWQCASFISVSVSTARSWPLACTHRIRLSDHVCFFRISETTAECFFVCIMTHPYQILLVWVCMLIAGQAFMWLYLLQAPVSLLAQIHVCMCPNFIAIIWEMPRRTLIWEM